MRSVSSWTPAQKARVTKYWHELQNLTAQPRYIYHTRSPSKLKQAQQVVQSEPGYKWKVAFIPHTPKILSSGKPSKAKPKIEFTAEGVRIREPGYRRSFVPLNPMKLAIDPQKEIKRAIKKNAPRAKHFVIQAGVNQMAGVSDKSNIIKDVIKLMNRYDGIKPLPNSSGNAGDAPKTHKWDRWLTGVIAYHFDKATQKNISEAFNTFDAARRSLQKKRKNMRARLKKAKLNRRK